MDQSSPYLLPLLFIAWWCFILYLISFFSGWRRLTEIYRFEGTFRGKIWGFQTIAMRWWTGYGSVVNIGADSRGLYLSVLILFRPGHPPLMLPWEDIRVREVRSLGRARLELRSRRTPDVPIRIKPGMGDKISGYLERPRGQSLDCEVPEVKNET